MIQERLCLSLLFIFACAPFVPQASAANTDAAKPAANSVVEWVSIPEGTFQMGSDEWSDTRPVHTVKVKAFELAKTPVTNKQYRACVAAGACSPVKACGNALAADDLPVTCVDWAQAHNFAKWVGGRLPSDSEWEYAAREAGKNPKYPWGADQVSVRPVCTNAAGNKLGLCDMSGTVWEWVQDWYHPSYAGAPADGSAWNDAGWDRVYVGGGFYFKGKDGKLVSPCRRLPPGTRRADLSFRVARS